MKNNNMGVELTSKDKIAIVANTKELTDCIRILYSVYKDCDLKEHITYEYDIEGEKFEFVFRKINQTENK